MANYLDRISPCLYSKADLYSPLNSERDQVRFLEILPSDTDNEPIRCLLKTMELTRNIRYAALSYVWGDRKDTKNIIVDGVEFPVTNNLASALWHLRKHGFPKHEGADDCQLLWVDAVCINQTDNSERNHQLLLMRCIYSNATSVLSWIRPPNKNSAHIDHALRAVHEFVDEMVIAPGISDCSASHEGTTQANFERPVSSSSNLNSESDIVSDYTSVKALGACEYWTRMWIIQEVALARSPKDIWIICGSKFLTLDELKVFFSVCNLVTRKRLPESIQHDHTKVMKRQSKVIRHPNIFRMMAADKLLSFVEQLQRGVQSGPAVPHRTLWENVISASLVASATDPRDMVYAVLGLVPNGIIPDYNKSVRQIYLDTILHDGIRKAVNISLQFSGRGYNIKNENELPSWLPDLPTLKSGNDMYFWDFRTDIGPSLKDIELREPELGQQTILNVQGTVCGHVKYSLGVIPFDTSRTQPDWCEILCQICIDYLVGLEIPPKIPFNTLSLSHRPLLAFTNLFCWMVKKYGQVFNKDVMEFWENTMSRFGNDNNALGIGSPYGFWLMGAILTHIGKSTMEQRKIVAKRLKLNSDDDLLLFVISCYTDTRRFFDDEIDQWIISPESNRFLMNSLMTCIEQGGMAIFQTDKGHIGMGPEGLQSGDFICAIDQCSLPVLLRKEEQAENEDSPFVHVGCCYVLGLSDGEPAEMVRTGELEIETFKIR